MRSEQEDQAPESARFRQQPALRRAVRGPLLVAAATLFFAAALFSTAALVFSAPAWSGTTWRGLVVAPENRCSAYSSGDYRYSQSVEDGLVAEYGGVYSPYTGQWFASDTETDIEHMVARSEAHDSGMCSRPAEERRAFANDLLNLTLSEPRLNRSIKSSKDAAEWLPEYNFCWFAGRIVAVKAKHRLSVDRAEAEALEGVLRSCGSTALVIYPRGEALPAPMPIPAPASLPAGTDPGANPATGPGESTPWQGPLTDIWLGPGQAMLLLHAADGAAVAVPLYFDASGGPGQWSAMTGHIALEGNDTDADADANSDAGAGAKAEGNRLTSDPALSDGRTAVYGVEIENPQNLRLELLSCTRQDFVRGETDCADPTGTELRFSRLAPRR